MSGISLIWKWKTSSNINYCCQHKLRSVEQQKLNKIVIEELLEPIIDDVDDIEILVNPTGSF